MVIISPHTDARYTDHWTTGPRSWRRLSVRLWGYTEIHNDHSVGSYLLESLALMPFNRICTQL